LPYIEAGKDLNYKFYVSGGNPPFVWSIKSGTLPDGLNLSAGKLTGTPTKPGIYPVEIQIGQGEKKSIQKINLIVRDVNIAPEAKTIIANVMHTDTTVRDEMWLTVGRSLYAPSVDVINDGRRLGNGSTFYSISNDLGKKVDYYGYEWSEPRNIGLLGYHTGSMEESGGWFTSLNVEYLDAGGNWQSVEGLSILPPLLPNEEPFNKAHFVEYLLAFKPVETAAIRMIGEAGTARHWRNKAYRFTSITELTVHGPLPGYQNLK
ncbi:MAG: putative Ig domain-containing protein, partial [Anaerolineales bacterium]